jgi:hypothetical protein
MSDLSNLSPEHIATLLDLAEKLQKRRENTAKSGAVVKRHNWSAVQSRLYAAKNDLKSAQFAYEKTRVAYERAEEAHGYDQRMLAEAEVRMQEAIAAFNAAGETEE